MMDPNYRFVYKGSVTTPPCATYVYWNVFAKVLPVKKKHLDLFKNLIAKKSPKLATAKTGNYRVICKTDKQDPKLMVPITVK